MSKGYVKSLNLSESKPDSRDESIFNNLAGGDAANDIRLFDGNLRNTSVLANTVFTVLNNLITVTEDGKVAFSNNTQVYEDGTPNTIYTVYESNGVDKFRLKDSNDNPYSPSLDLIRSDAVTFENLSNINVRRLETISQDQEELELISTDETTYDTLSRFTIIQSYNFADDFSANLNYKRSQSLLNDNDNNFEENIAVNGYVRITNISDVTRDDTSPGIFIVGPDGTPQRAFEGDNNPWSETGTSLETTITESVVNTLKLTDPNISGLTIGSDTGAVSTFTHMLKTTIDGEEYFLLLKE